MLIIGDTIVSDDIVERHFCCQLQCCKGQCCVEGDCGAPLERDEIPILERILDTIKPYMTEAGWQEVEQTGVWVYDNDFEPCTPLINNRECAYIAQDATGTAFCAIEKAFRDGRIDFMKPISCHLYPIRVDRYPEFSAVNYHQWEVCGTQGNVANAQPLYRYLKEPLIRKFGQQWYDELLSCIKKQKEERTITDR